MNALAEVGAAYDELFPDLDPFHRRVRLVTAEEYGMPSIRVADAFRAGGGRAYVYRFLQPARSGPFAGWAGLGFELPYVWQSFADPTLAAIAGLLSDAMRRLADEMTARWCMFIRGNAPNIDGLSTWLRFDGRRILCFDGRSGEADVIDEREAALWRTVHFDADGGFELHAACCMQSTKLYS